MAGSQERDAWKSSLKADTEKKKSRFGRWFRGVYVNWQSDYFRETGTLGRVPQFADFLGEVRATVAMWLSGRRLPTGNHVHRIANKLGTQEIYDVLELQRPDPDLMRVIESWSSLSPSKRRRIVKSIHASVSEGD